MNNPYKKFLLIILGVIAAAALIYLAIFGRALLQPENHLAIAFALPKAISSSEAVRIDNRTYLAKNREAFLKTMENQGYTFTDQEGAGYFLIKTVSTIFP